MSLLAIETVTVGQRQVEALVRVAGAVIRTSAAPGIADRAFGLLPGLARHSCKNDRGVDFRRELADTQTAHLYEHVTCELMALAGSPRRLKGETRWDFARDGLGVYHVSVEYDVDVIAIGALNEAASVVEWLLTPNGEAPEIDAIAQSLGVLRTD